MKTITKSSLLLSGVALASLGSLKAQILVSDTIATAAQNPGIYNSSLSGTTVETFDSLSVGDHYNVNFNGVGSINDVSVIPNNVYGGQPSTVGNNSDAGNFAVQTTGAGEVTGTKDASTGKYMTAVPETVITLNQNSSYFGLYWSAGDSANRLSFWNGDTLVGAFSTASLMSKLPAGYDGNPNPAFLHGDGNEPFGFINFTGLNGSSWNRIVLDNSASSGFESDNWTTRVDAWNPTTDGSFATTMGTPVSLVTTVAGANTSSSTLINSVTVTGNTVTVTTIAGTTTAVVAQAPGAPAPPLSICLAFAGVLLLRSFKTRVI